MRLDNDERATELDVGAKPVWGSSVLTDPRLHACMQSAGRRSKGVAHLEGRQTQITNSTAAAAIAAVCRTQAVDNSRRPVPAAGPNKGVADWMNLEWLGRRHEGTFLVGVVSSYAKRKPSEQRTRNFLFLFILLEYR